MNGMVDYYSPARGSSRSACSADVRTDRIVTFSVSIMEEIMANERLTGALDYAARGWRVVPDEDFPF